MSPTVRVRIIGVSIALAFGLVAACRAEELKGIKWEQAPRRAAESSKETSRPVMLYVTADYCGYCRKLEKETWADSTVAKLVNERFIPLKVDGTREQRLVKTLEIDGFPAVIILSPEGEVLGRVDGYVGSKDMLARLKKSLPTEISGRASLP